MTTTTTTGSEEKVVVCTCACVCSFVLKVLMKEGGMDGRRSRATGGGHDEKERDSGEKRDGVIQGDPCHVTFKMTIPLPLS